MYLINATNICYLAYQTQYNIPVYYQLKMYTSCKYFTWWQKLRYIRIQLFNVTFFNFWALTSYNYFKFSNFIVVEKLCKYFTYAIVFYCYVTYAFFFMLVTETYFSVHVSFSPNKISSVLLMSVVCSVYI